MCSCDCLMVKGEGAQKQRTHTPRQENAHIDTLWEQGGAGTLEVWARVCSGAGLSKCSSFTAGYGQVTWSKECILKDVQKNYY